MGKPSDKCRSARRPSKQARARAKKRTTWGFGIKRSGLWSSAWGADTETAYLGRKKWKRQTNISQGRNRRSHLVGLSDDLERRAKALGPHSEQAGVMQFPMGKPRSERLSAEQAELIRAGAHEIGKPSIALAQAIQFDGTLRQRDVIGEWVPINERNFTSAVISGYRKWGRGLDWREIDENWMLAHVTNKRQKLVVVDLKLAPMVVEELTKLHGLDRSKYPASGPVIVSERHGQPWAEQEFRRYWRMIANKQGIPSTVRNMDSRAGAITEAFEAGANPESIRKSATHGQLSMTTRYSRNEAEATAEVLTLRGTHRQNKKGS